MTLLREVLAARADDDHLLAQHHLVRAFELVPGVAHRALRFLNELQTSDEQAAGKTLHANGVGFSKADAAEAQAIATCRACTTERCKELAEKYALQVVRHSTDEELAHIMGEEQPSPAPRKRARRARPADDDDDVVDPELEDSDDDVVDPELEDSDDEKNPEAVDDETVERVQKTPLGLSGSPITQFSAVILNDLDRVLIELGVTDPAAPRGLNPPKVLERMRRLHAELKAFDVHVLLYGALRRAEARVGDRVFILWEEEGVWYPARVTEITEPRKFPRVAYEDDDPPSAIVCDEWMYTCGSA
jgi:hypothetical protein